MRIVKYNNNNVFPSLMNEFFNDDFGMNLFNRRHSVPSVNSVENNDSFEIDLAVPGMKKDDFTIELNDKILVISTNNSDYDQNENIRLYSCCTCKIRIYKITRQTIETNRWFADDS